MTSKNNKAPLLYYIKLCASFQIHWWIQTRVTVRKYSIRVKIGDFLSRVTLKFDGWPWKRIGHLFYITLSVVQHFKAIGIYKLELKSGNAQFGSKLANFFVPGDFENWRMTLKNNRAPLLYYVKLCASFQIHWWSQTWVTASKRSSRAKNGDFLSRVTLKIDVWHWKTIGHLSYAASTFVRHFMANGEFKLELQSGNAQFGSKSTSSKQHQALSIISSPYVKSNWSYGPETAKWGHDLCDLDLWPWPLALTSCLSMVITPENFRMIRWQEHCQKSVTGGQTEISVLRAAWSHLRMIQCGTVITRWVFSKIPTIDTP